MPVLAVGGQRADWAFGAITAATLRQVATNVTEAIIPNAGHWLIEENPDAVVNLVWEFIQ